MNIYVSGLFLKRVEEKYFQILSQYNKSLTMFLSTSLCNGSSAANKILLQQIMMRMVFTKYGCVHNW